MLCCGEKWGASDIKKFSQYGSPALLTYPASATPTAALAYPHEQFPATRSPAASPAVIARSMFSTLLQKIWCSYGSLLVLVDIAILLNQIGKLSKCQWLTYCLVFSSF